MMALPRLAFAVALAGALASPAAAETYPWCSNFADGAGTNCGWSTLEQCMITVRGSGGYCSQNDAAKPTAAPPPSHRIGKRHIRKDS
jgi:hypothetical protein